MRSRPQFQIAIFNDHLNADRQLIAKLASGGIFYYHQDHLGNTRLVTKDANGRTDFSSNYQPSASCQLPLVTIPSSSILASPGD